MSETHGNPSDHHSHDPAALPEPKTPMWLTALGAVLFLMVGLICALMPETKQDAGTTEGAATGSAH
ncbi:MAG TPA: hypothetical protein VM580_30805 [Labilithrix sp.]|jgi:hypothetical protein|nr:hypothetical protein [Labilithrix sp.]